MDKKLHYAAGYYPLIQKREDWEKDLAHMKKCKITLIRTAELFCSWDQIEPKEGTYEFEWLDEFFDLCETYGMKILLGTGTATPPYWIYKKYPDVRIQNNHGEFYPMNASYSWACFDHPEFLKEAERYITTLVKRYSKHPALYAYQIHNEISFPFMPLDGNGVDIYCYNEPSCEKFRGWLKQKYQNIGALNEAYTWGATHTCHSSFEEVEPPRAMPYAWSSVTRWLDWRLFWMENTVDYVKWQNALIKQYDTTHITTTNIFFLKSQDPFGVLTGLDQFEMAKAVDVIGYDIYPGSGNKTESIPEFSSMCLDMGRSTADLAGRDYWLLETESGPINGWVLGPSRNVTGKDLYRNVLDAFSHGAKVSLYQGFREWDFQPIHWGGLVDLDGEPTERLESAEKIGNLIERMEEVIDTGHTEKAKIAIGMCKENAILLKGMDQEKFLHTALRGAYRVFWENYYQVDFVSQDMLTPEILKAYKVVYLPFFAYVTEEMAQGLAEYVKEGGMLIGTARLGMLGTHGWYNHRMPCFELEKVFGIDAREAVSNVTPRITYKRKIYKGCWHQEKIHIEEPDVEVLARFGDDTPAVTSHKYGKGKAFYFATHPDAAYLTEQSYLLWDILAEILPESGVLPKVEIFFSEQQVREFDGSLMLGEKEAFLLVTSSFTGKYTYSETDSRLLEVVLRLDRSIKNIQGIISRKSYSFVQNKEELRFSMKLKKNQSEVVWIEYEE